MAAIIYGEPCLTVDLDLVLRLDPDTIRPFAAAYPPAEFYVPPVETIEQEAGRESGGHFNLLNHDSALRADIYLASEDPLDRWGLANRRQETVGGEPVWIAPAEYLIVRKLEYFRQGGPTKHLDDDDIAAILRVSPARVALPTLQEFVAQRGLEAEWQWARGLSDAPGRAVPASRAAAAPPEINIANSPYRPRPGAACGSPPGSAG